MQKNYYFLMEDLLGLNLGSRPMIAYDCRPLPASVMSLHTALSTAKNAQDVHLVFQNEAKNIPRQDFVVMIIFCKFDKFTYNILGSRGATGISLCTAAVYSCIIHSIHWMLPGGYNKRGFTILEHA